MGKYYTNIITTTAGFNLPAETPIDDRFVVSSRADLDAFVNTHRAYTGLVVYVTDDSALYVYDGSNWTIVQGGGSTDIDEDTINALIDDKVNSMIDDGVFDDRTRRVTNEVLSEGDFATQGDIDNSISEIYNSTEFQSAVDYTVTGLMDSGTFDDTLTQLIKQEILNGAW